MDASSDDRHRLSQAGNRRINRALHIMTIVQLRHDTEGRLRAHEKGYIFITLGYPVLAIALLSSRRAIAAAGVSV